MKIVHLCLSAFFIDNYSYQENMLAKYHTKQGHDVTVIASLFTFDEKGKGAYLSKPTEHYDVNGFKVYRLGYKTPTCLNRLFRHYDGLKGLLDKLSPDLIFSHGLQFGDARIVRDYLKTHTKVVFYADNHADYINSAKNWLSKHIIHPILWRNSVEMLEPYLKKYWGVTPLRCQFVKEMYHVNPSIVEFLPMGVDDDIIPSEREKVRLCVRKELGVQDDEILIFTGGKIDRLKNTHILIDSLLKINIPSLHLVICGTLTPEMVHLEKVINNNPQIHYLGWCNADRVMKCMVASDLACFPGTHSTLWEQAVGVGLPMICKHWDGMEHVNVCGNCVFVKGEDVSELENHLVELTTPQKLQNIKTAAIDASSSFLYSNISRKAIGR